jgi:hypothetical protein
LWAKEKLLTDIQRGFYSELLFAKGNAHAWPCILSHVSSEKFCQKIGVNSNIPKHIRHHWTLTLLRLSQSQLSTTHWYSLFQDS